MSQVVELQNRLSEESKKADKMEFEYKRVKEKVDSLQKEKDVCIQQEKSTSLCSVDAPSSRTHHPLLSLINALFSAQRMRTERDSLKETIEELHCVQAQEGQLTSGTAGGSLPTESANTL